MAGMIVLMIIAGYLARRMMFWGMGGFFTPWYMAGFFRPWGMGRFDRRPPLGGMGPMDRGPHMGHGPGMGHGSGMGHGPGMGPGPRR